MSVSRRSVLKLAGGAGLALAAVPALTGCSATSELNPGELVSKAKLPAPFTVPLPFPTPTKPVATDAGRDRYTMALKAAEVEILPGYRTRIWGYEGTFPGPCLEARSGVPMVVSQTNQLTVPVVTHLHGGLTPPSDDGFPTDLVYPASLADMADPAKAAAMPGMPGMPAMNDPLAHTSAVERTYTFPMRQRAATLWYHDYRMDFTGAQVWKGLFGLCVVRDDEEAKLPLPHGERELPLLITDRAFDADGQLAYPSHDPTLLGKAGMAKSIMGGATGDDPCQRRAAAVRRGRGGAVSAAVRQRLQRPTL
ncbi:multicopper oxidase family protein [Streptomyces sp. NPDC087901]|uniref:multicopper oxidase family protein n=1 Tax=Streptomyces sp. NPDC087901 TaxID=3365818 RepID=UPI003820DD8A